MHKKHRSACSKRKSAKCWRRRSRKSRKARRIKRPPTPTWRTRLWASSSTDWTMEMKGRKEQARQIASSLQKSSVPEVKQVKEMISLLLEDVKHNLISAEGDMVLRLQGEARVLSRLFEQLTT